MNYPILFLKPYYKLYLLLLKYNLNTSYFIIKFNNFNLFNYVLHKKWLKTHKIIFRSSTRLLSWTNRTSMFYFQQNANHKLIKYIQITMINHNSNRTLQYLISTNKHTVSQIELYNLWFKLNNFFYNQQTTRYIIFLKSFVNLNYLQASIKANWNHLSSIHILPTLKLLHNIKFL